MKTERIKGLKPVDGSNGDIFLDDEGRLYSLEKSLMTGERRLVAH